MRRVLPVASRAIQAQLARRVARWGRRAGKVLAVVALACASLLVTGSSGKLGVDCLHVRQDRHVRGGAGDDQGEAGAKLAPGELELGGGELADVVGPGHAVSRMQ